MVEFLSTIPSTVSVYHVGSFPKLDYLWPLEGGENAYRGGARISSGTSTAFLVKMHEKTIMFASNASVFGRHNLEVIGSRHGFPGIFQVFSKAN
jgi:hypothetical protein